MPQIIHYLLYGQGNIIGFTTYFHIRNAELLINNQFFDPLSYGGRPLTYPLGYPVILAIFFNFKEFVNVFFGCLLVLLAYFFSLNYFKNEKKATLCAVFVGIMHISIYLSGHINPRLPSLFFFMLSLMFIDKKILSGLSLGTSFLIHPAVGAVGSFISFVLYKKKSLIPIVLGLTIFSLWFIPTILQYGFPKASNVYSQFTELQRGPQYYIFETFSNQDSIQFGILLIGFIAWFRTKDTFLKKWLFIAILIPLLLGNRFNEQIIVPLALLVSENLQGNLKFLAKKFNVNYVFFKSLFIFYCFVTVLLGIGAVALISPNVSQFKAFKFLKENTPENSTILASMWYGHWIAGIANRKNVMDAYLEYAPNPDERFKDIQKVFSGSEKEVLQILDKYSANYIYYDGGEESPSNLLDLVEKGKLRLIYQDEKIWIFEKV
ncbi:MAG: hypothetical protein QXJ62_00660 [Nitrososphaeria archaeon]